MKRGASASRVTAIDAVAVRARASSRSARRHVRVVAARAAGGSDAGAPPASSAPPSTAGGMRPELRSAIDSFISENTVVLFMKGTRQFPQCGFSNTCIVILEELIGELKRNAGEGAAEESVATASPRQIGYETVNVLDDDSLRTGMKEYSSWPTFPQLYVGGEFVGGCDIVMQQYQNGELIEMIERALAE